MKRNLGVLARFYHNSQLLSSDEFVYTHGNNVGSFYVMVSFPLFLHADFAVHIDPGRP